MGRGTARPPASLSPLAVAAMTALAFCGCRETPGGGPDTAQKPSAPSRSTEPTSIVTRGIQAMGTLVECTVVFEGEKTRADSAIAAAFDEIARVEAMLSTYKPDSALSKLNASSGGPPVAVPDELMSLIEQSKTVSELTRGKFDISFGPLGRLWDFKAERPALPDPDALKAATSLVDYTAIEVDAEKKTVRLAIPGMRLGLGAIAKGYAVDRASGVLRANGYRNFIFYAGGDLLVSGNKAGRPWRVGIQDPRKRSRYFAKFEMPSEGAVVTSGDYEQFFELDGKRYHHLLDPDTGRPFDGTVSVTVVAPETARADALATGVFGLGPAEGMRLIEADPTIEGIIVDSALQVHVSSGLKSRVELTPIKAH